MDIDSAKDLLKNIDIDIAKKSLENIDIVKKMLENYIMILISI